MTDQPTENDVVHGHNGTADAADPLPLPQDGHPKSFLNQRDRTDSGFESTRTESNASKYSGVLSQSSTESEMNGVELCEWYTYVLDEERGSHKYGFIEEEPENLTALGGPPPPPHGEQQEKKDTSGTKTTRVASDGGPLTEETTTSPEDKRVTKGQCSCVVNEQVEVFLLADKRSAGGSGIVIEQLSGPEPPPTVAGSRVVTDSNEYTSDSENYFAAITIKDEHGEDKQVQRLLEVRYCPPDESREEFDLAEPTAELMNEDPEAKLKVRRDGSRPKPGHDTGHWCTESNVYVGVDTVKCEPKTFSKPPTDSRRYLMAVTINVCTRCNREAPIAIYWAVSDDKNYYLAPKQEGHGWKVCIKRDTKQNIYSYRLWSNRYHNTGQ